MLLRIDIEQWFELTHVNGAVNGDGEILVDVTLKSRFLPLMLRVVGWAIRACVLLRIPLSVEIGWTDPASGWTSSLFEGVPGANTVDPP